METFTGVRVAILCKFLGFTLKSAQVIQQKIRLFGGQASILGFEEPPSPLSHIIAPASIDLALFQSKVGAVDDQVQVVTPDWAYQSLSRKRVLPPDQYALHLNDPVSKGIEEVEQTQETQATQEMTEPPVTLPQKRLPETQLKKDIGMEEHEPRARSLFNVHITKELEKLVEHLEALGDISRVFGYQRVINILKLLPYPVTDATQLCHIRGIGKRSRDKIQEILDHGSLTRAKVLGENERVKGIEALKTIHGIGGKQANRLFSLGVDSVEKLVEYAQQHLTEFTQNQHAAIKIHEDLAQKIPRSEVEAIAQLVKTEVLKLDNRALYEPCGSYRRGRELCGDIDIVIGSDKPGLLTKLVATLQGKGVLTDTFGTSGMRFMGVIKVFDLHRRIDIFVDSTEKFPFRVLTYTGSRNYNRYIRIQAKRQGYHLGNSEMTVILTGQHMKVRSEEEVIELLGLPVLTPQQRDI